MPTQIELAPAPAARVVGAPEEEAWRRLRRLLRGTRGRFALILVESTLSADETLAALARLRREARELALGLLEMELSYERWDALALLDRALKRASRHPDVVLLRGLERTPPAPPAGDSAARPLAFARLNVAREALERRLAVPLLLWGSPRSLEALREHAPDFFDHFAGIVRFESTEAPTAGTAAVHLLDEGPNPPNQAMKVGSPPGAQRAAIAYEQLLSRAAAAPAQRRSWLLGWAEALAQSPASLASEREAALAQVDAMLAELEGTDLEILARAQSIRGALLRAGGRRREAAEATLRAIEGYRALSRPAAEGAALALALQDLSGDWAELGRLDDAVVSLLEAVRLLRLLEEARPGAFQAELAAAENNLAVRWSGLNRRDEAVTAGKEAVALYRRLVRERSETFRPALATALSNLGLDLADVGRREESLAASEESVEIALALARSRSGGPSSADLARKLYARGLVLSAAGRPDGAVSVLQQALRELLDLPSNATAILRELAVDVVESLVFAAGRSGREPEGTLLDEVERRWPDIVRPESPG